MCEYRHLWKHLGMESLTLLFTAQFKAEKLTVTFLSADKFTQTKIFNKKIGRFRMKFNILYLTKVTKS